ncbi:tryptophan synthase subunit alpha [Corynebacterium uterequi]|uniref:Tryptophan synthase alpha chain n=1 Tax=Corynebacterium uterequi TaxID=1072256 RepID=A0A0G3HM46_9CORY|nr:tryptophan synthase subunit alpha [Corynebacterium uterequi]AKK12172.1 tryptophan synthase, alpha chain [Corynebacterium uterequi]
MSDRYRRLFARLDAAGEGAFVPFVMLADPSVEESFEIISTIVDAGADALELGVPFSDPIADGPTIQRSHIRALDGGATVSACLELISRIRQAYPDLPIGMLIYSNVAYVRGVEKFYREFAEAGADSILLPDVPVREGQVYAEAAEAAGIDPIFIAPAQAGEDTLRGVATRSRGYIYAISRDGVTGTERSSQTTGLSEVVANVTRFDGAPVLLGFGISAPEHVRDAIDAGAAGAITGSAITAIISAHTEGEHPNPGRVTDMAALKAQLRAFVADMKAATIR